MVMKYPEIFGNSIKKNQERKEAEWDKTNQARRQICKLHRWTSQSRWTLEVTKEALEPPEKIFKKSSRLRWKKRSKKEKVKDADLVYTV